MPDAELVWGWVADQRRALADSLALLPAAAWDRPSLCAGWRVRDAVGHLVFLAEGSRPSVTVDVLRQLRLPGEALSRIARREGEAAPDELIARLRAAAGGRFVVPSQPPQVSLGEVVVHGIDALRPVDGDEPVTPAYRLLPVAEAYRRIGPIFSLGRHSRKVRFVATDGDWAVGPIGGPVARGAALEIVLALAGRPEGVRNLAGPGADLLA